MMKIRHFEQFLAHNFWTTEPNMPNYELSLTKLSKIGEDLLELSMTQTDRLTERQSDIIFLLRIRLIWG